ncbi:hypothetical protein SUH3_11975 [Pseudosulfitobacter pseudonitzschiae]|uniref:DUF2190 family protein n=1 Tax=Pseudosulfitobacter pseudonitzschiae TaxID=1402135 RepID=A0A073J8F2_9RHOB|nr:DUF2190 family protein [Pseudosulfitobacter pseudonitzschiae]KEJ93982.1 hypothetical protein SUH3_11975 [Pseudosulfitobacter pseudonitzschiae]
MKNYIQEGKNLTVPAPYDVEPGAGVLVGAMFGFATGKALAGELVTIARTGVYSHQKLGAQAWVVGAKVFWNDANRECTTVASGNTHIGFAVAAAADPSAEGLVALI